ncbi:MAG: FAD-binding protein, partial [Acetobacteraceae bacterium]
YQGTSDAADSLLIWTRAMNGIVLHDAFVPQGCAGKLAAQPAVTVEAGAIWMHVYDAVTTQAGRDVQGGGCATVGVAGLVQSGGFGSFSKNYGTAAGGLLEAETVTADGQVRIANACTNPDLFWGIKGGGGGSLGVVTGLTLRTRELPASFGGVGLTVKAASEAAFHRLIERFAGFCGDRLLNPHWGESINFGADNTLTVRMIFQGLDRQQADEVWRPFVDWMAAPPHDFTITSPLNLGTMPARDWWNPAYIVQHRPGRAFSDQRPGAPADNVWFAEQNTELGVFIHGYQSIWLPAPLLHKERRRQFADALSRPRGILRSRCISTRGSPAPTRAMWRRPGRLPPIRRCWPRSRWRSLPAATPGRTGTYSARYPISRPRAETPLLSAGPPMNCGKWCRTQVPTCRKAISLSATGNAPSGPTMIRGCGR